MQYIIALVIVLIYTLAFAQDHGHQHPPRDMPLHEKFYSTWMRPDNPVLSCCNNQDCYPTAARYDGRNWYARRREDGKWLRVPASKIEQNRDSPDGGAHLCAPPPEREEAYENGVICFSVGGGS